MSQHLTVYTEATVKHLCGRRHNEKKVWKSLALLDTQVDPLAAMHDAKQFGIRYVLLGVCEDIGPRANGGNGGAEDGWQAFLNRFLNQPNNQFVATEKVLLLGEVNLDDLVQKAQHLDNQNPEQLTQLRTLCAEIDERVTQVLKLVFAAGLEPIIIGGGHNNCYGIIRALSQSKNAPVNAINFDPHADFRDCEGRHSGNGFRYAYEEKYLNNYHVMGFHEQKNNQTIIDALKAAHFSYDSYQQIQVKRDITLTEACQQALCNLNDGPLGIEVDLDSISHMPASAYTYCGFSVSDAEHFVYLAATQKNTHYIHLCEAAPNQDPNGLTTGMNASGQIITALVNTYLSARESIHNS